MDEKTASLTTRVKEKIPDILKKAKNHQLNFDEMLIELKNEFPEEMVDKHDVVRSGVLRGLLSRIKETPDLIENVIYITDESTGRKVLKYYGSQLDRLDAEVSKFLSAVKEQDLLSINILSVPEEDVDKIMQYQKLILELNKLQK